MKLRNLLLTAACYAAPVALLSGVPTIAAAQTAIPGVKNVIIVINDGAGNTVYDATRMYLGKPLVTDGEGFKKIHISTYPLREDGTVNGVNNNTPGSLLQQQAVVYTTARFWDTTPVAGASTATGYTAYPAGFRGYEFSRFAHPDSGNTASSLANGKKSYNNSINVDGAGFPQVTITDLIDQARKVGKRTGVVTTVQFGDATPAALGGAHNVARANRTNIANELFSNGKLDVIGGAGNPDFNDDGVARTPAYTWVSAALWADLKNKTNLTGLNTLKWPLIQQKADVDALANGTVKPPIRAAMILRGDNGLNFYRSGDNQDPATPHTKAPFTDPVQPNTPTLQNLSRAALNILGGRGRGFYLMIEAGSVDRAEHANNTGRMIEEQIESDNTVQAVIDWVNRPDTAATWDDTLLIVTADHDHLLYGPDGATVPFQPLTDNGPGVTPGNRWFGPNHGTGLVPLYAYGKGADDIAALATQTDDTGIDLINPADGKSYHLGNGAYTDQTVIGQTLKATLGVTK